MSTRTSETPLGTWLGKAQKGRPEREGQIELVGDWNPGSKAPPRSKKRRERREQRKC